MGGKPRAHQRSSSARPLGPPPVAASSLVQFFCLVLAVAVIVADVSFALWDAGLQPSTGALDASFDTAPSGAGFVRVAEVEPGGVMAMAGVTAGDRIAFDRSYDYLRRLKAGEILSFTLDHAGGTSRHRIVVPPRNAVEQLDFAAAIFDIANAVAALMGAFIIWRSQRRPASLLLGMALVAFGVAWTAPPAWLAPALFPYAFTLARFLVIAGSPVLFYAFALRFRQDYGGSTKRWERALFQAYAMVQFATTGAMAVSLYKALVFPVVGGGTTVTDIGSDIGLVICLGYLFLGWRRSAAGDQQRYALMLLGVGTVVIAQIDANFLAPSGTGPADVPSLLLSAVLGGLIGPALLTYAILRHRVFDLGFAVNRTLVYAVVSAILLAAFGLIEWAVDHFVPIRGREGNALVDAAIAVVVFLTFHRVRDFVQHAIESLFFRRWQIAEAEFRRFVREAAFVTQPAALAEAFVKALADYTEGAQAAVYLSQARGYARVVGEMAGLPARLDPDLPVVVSLRADPKPMELRDDALAAALVAPMVNRNEVVGLALLAPKPNGLDFRPDEIELIGWATRQVGLDLHALKVEQLETEKADLSKTVAVLEHALSLRSATV